MSRNGSIDLDLAGQPHFFRLDLGALEALQEATDTGPAEHLHRLYEGRGYSFRHVREIVRAGLIGGGMLRSDARAIVLRLDDLPTAEVVTVALLIVAAALEGMEDERLPTPRAEPQAEEMPNGKLAFARFYAAGAAMKLSLADLRAMSLWQFHAWLLGHNRAQNPDGPEPISPAEADALWDWIKPAEGGAEAAADAADGVR